MLESLIPAHMKRTIAGLHPKFSTYTTPNSVEFSFNYNTGSIVFHSMRDIEVRGMTFNGSKYCETFTSIEGVINYINTRFIPEKFMAEFRDKVVIEAPTRKERLRLKKA